MQLTAGSLLQGGKYLINHPLETQGFGVTYRGTQTYHGQPIVIKTLHPALHQSRAYSRLRDRFIDVASLLTRCQHPSVVRVTEIFQEGDLPFVVTEYVPGQNLAEIVKPGKGMAEMEGLHYIRLIGNALTTTHRFGLVHGNLKPRNIIRRAGSNLPVLVGYGISAERMLAAVQYAVPGFPHEFSAPEQIGEKADRPVSADIYGLAANLYFLLTGHPPLKPIEDHPEGPYGAISQQLPLLSLIQPGLQRAIVQGMSHNPAQRPKHIEDWLRLLPTTNAPRQVRPEASQPERLPERQIPERQIPERQIIANRSTLLQNPPPPTPPSTPPPIVTPTQVQTPTQIQASPTEVQAPPTTPTKVQNIPRPAFRTTPVEPVPPRPRFRNVPRPVEVAPVEVAPVEVAPVEVALPDRANANANRRSFPKKWLIITSSIAAAIGLGFGLALRFSAAKSATGDSMFHAEQSFPPRDWKGTLQPTDLGDAPLESRPDAPAPSPTPSPAPSPTPSPTPTEIEESPFNKESIVPATPREPAVPPSN